MSLIFFIFLYILPPWVGPLVLIPGITALVAPRRGWLALRIVSLAIVLTILSAVAVNVLHCDQPCGLVCPPQPCTSVDLYAGFPVPFLSNSSEGSSPLSSTDRIDFADYPHRIPVIVNILVYSGLLWGIWGITRRPAPPALLADRAKAG